MKKDSLLHEIKLDSRVILPGNIFLAPMAGFTDRSFRQICIEYGADLCFTEMVSCEALVRENGRTLDLAKPADNEQSYAVQIFTSNPESAAKASRQILPLKPAFLDLNCGCPVPKIIKSGAGSALMKTPELIGEIVKAVKEESGIPVTVKIRSGWDASSITYLHAAEIAQASGAAMISLHPRTRSQGYSGKADWKMIRELKKNSSVPVTGSGDLFTPEDGIRMLEETGCDAVMIARGAVGQPDIFRNIKTLALRGEKTALTPAEKLDTALRHFNLSVRYNGEKIACSEMKKQLCAYTKGMEGSANARNRIVHCQSPDEYREVLRDFMMLSGKD